MIGKKLHRDMAEVNVYTARRLREMACALSGLAMALMGLATALLMPLMERYLY